MASGDFFNRVCRMASYVKNAPGADPLDGFIISETLTFALDKSVSYSVAYSHDT